jgi:hypothetical protein
MSKATRFFTTVAVAAVVAVIAILFVTRTASAQVGRTAVCIGTSQLENTSEWMNAQLKAGKTQFVEISRVQFCAW